MAFVVFASACVADAVHGGVLGVWGLFGFEDDGVAGMDDVLFQERR